MKKRNVAELLDIIASAFSHIMIKDDPSGISMMSPLAKQRLLAYFIL